MNEVTLKSTGIVRKLDELGRITLPIELRRNLHLGDRESIEIYVDDDKIVLKKYQPCDVFTGDIEDLVDFCGKKVSKANIIALAEAAGLEVTN